jgi:hypothetical protein
MLCLMCYWILDLILITYPPPLRPPSTHAPTPSPPLLAWPSEHTENNKTSNAQITKPSLVRSPTYQWWLTYVWWVSFTLAAGTVLSARSTHWRVNPASPALIAHDHVTPVCSSISARSFFCPYYCTSVSISGYNHRRAGLRPPPPDAFTARVETRLVAWRTRYGVRWCPPPPPMSGVPADCCRVSPCLWVRLCDGGCGRRPRMQLHISTCM